MFKPYMYVRFGFLASTYPKIYIGVEDNPRTIHGSWSGVFLLERKKRAATICILSVCEGFACPRCGAADCGEPLGVLVWPGCRTQASGHCGTIVQDTINRCPGVRSPVGNVAAKRGTSAVSIQIFGAGGLYPIHRVEHGSTSFVGPWCDRTRHLRECRDR